MPLPRLRYLDAFEVESGRGEFISVRDPENIQEEVFLVPKFIYFVAQFFDGRREMSEVQEILARALDGEIVPSEVIDKIIEELDQRYLLQTPRFEKKCEEIEKTFASDPVRPAYLAKRSYPGTARELRKLLDGFFDKGPGARPAAAGQSPLKGFIAPHIDYHRGGLSYAHVYKAVGESKPADTYVILGVAHASPPAPFVLTEKDFKTPLGTAECDRDFTSRLRARLKSDPTRFQLVHRTEHSAEFQAVYLKHVVSSPFKIVPILCSSFEPICGDASPAKYSAIEGFIDALAQTIAESKGTVCVMSGADLAHVGRRFGDDFDITDEVVARVKQQDDEGLKKALEGDAEGFYASVMDDENARKVCGLSSIYTALRLIGSPGKLLDYNYAPDPAGGIVSFASVVYGGS